MTKNYSVRDFGDDFIWGVSTAAFQIEGGHDADGKGPSVWDHFSTKKGKILNGENANVACDFYNLYEDDLQLMQSMNIPNYRFSIAWSRIFPDGTGTLNTHGVAFYHQLIDACLVRGIEPWVTLYHWDLPQRLQDKGGWTNRDVVNWFLEFVSFCIKTYGHKVKHWMVLNEPMVFTGAGYFLGVHAPGKKGLSNFLAAAHHAALSQAEGGRLIKSLLPDATVGTTFSYSHIEPRSESERDRKAAAKVDSILNRFYLEPLLGLGYPTTEVRLLNGIERYMKEGDDARLAFDMDFIGLQNYTREIVKYDFFRPFVRASIVKADKRKVDRTLMNWEVYPPCIYHALKRLGSYEGIRRILVTENGAAFPDIVTHNEVMDPHRTAYLQDHIAQVLQAKREGVKVDGYFVWTFMDNFEWAEGYHPRFGLVHVNFSTQQRILKSSGKWYSSFLGERETKKATPISVALSYK